MSYVVADGKSNWLEGVILVCKPFPIPVQILLLKPEYKPGLYIIIAVSFWFYPGKSFSNETSSRVKIFSINRLESADLRLSCLIGLFRTLYDTIT